MNKYTDMQPDMVSLMQQLVTAVQSIALSVDVMSMDMRALNKNVALLVKKNFNEGIAPMTLGPDCSYAQGSESSHGIAIPTASQMPAMPSTSSCQFAGTDQGEKPETHEKFPRIREGLLENIRKAASTHSGLETTSWKKEWDASLNGRRWGGEWGQRTAATATATVTSEKMGNRSMSQQAVVEKRRAPESNGTLADGRAEEGLGVMGTVGSMGAMGAVEMLAKKGRTFRCVWCGKEFTDNGKLKRHWRVHTGEKPFTCFQCGKAFACKENLVVHGQVHLELRPFSCDTCGKSFKGKDKLARHKKMHREQQPQSQQQPQTQTQHQQQQQQPQLQQQQQQQQQPVAVARERQSGRPEQNEFPFARAQQNP